MTLLKAITDASANPTVAVSAHPIVVAPGAPPPPPPPPIPSALPTLIPPRIWSLATANADLAAAASSLTAALPTCASAPRLHTLLASFLATLAQSPTPPENVPQAIRTLAPYFPTALAPLVASAAMRVAEHDILLALAESRLLRHPPPDLVASLADTDRADIVCAVVRNAADLRSSEVHAALRCFLSPGSQEAYDAMIVVRRRWKVNALFVVDKCGEKLAKKKARKMKPSKEKKERKKDAAEKKARDVARRAALLLMMGYDGFSSPELCLHYLFASGNVDSVVLGAAVAELDGGEVVRLMKYLHKWIEKYQRFPEAQPCPEAAGMFEFEVDQCDSVPPFAVVTRALGVVLDNHLSHLVLNADVREDLRAAEKMLKELAAEAVASGPILDLLRRLKQENRDMRACS